MGSAESKLEQARTNENGTLDIAGRTVPLTVKRHKNAKNMLLRLNARSGGVDLILPAWVSLKRGLDFVSEKQDWLAANLAQLAPLVPFQDGAVIPFQGIDHRIRHHQGRRGGINQGDGEILVVCDAPHLERRVRDFLIAQAKSEISTIAQPMAAELGVTVKRITIRDTRSRWGSCSPAGRLNFSWRLILAPPDVLRYVVAHEVSHLREMNHGPAFWHLVDGLCPGNRPARAWLKRHGQDLHRYGAN